MLYGWIGELLLVQSGSSHCSVIKRILRYLWGTKDYMLCYQSPYLNLVGYMLSCLAVVPFLGAARSNLVLLYRLWRLSFWLAPKLFKRLIGWEGFFSIWELSHVPHILWKSTIIVWIHLVMLITLSSHGCTKHIDICYNFMRHWHKRK